MSAAAASAERLLGERFIVEYPQEAAREIELLDQDEAVRTLAAMPVTVVAPMAPQLLPEAAARIFDQLPDAQVDALLAELPASYVVRMFGHLSAAAVQARLQRLDRAIRDELQTLLDYPPETAGRMMETDAPAFRPEHSAGEVLQRLRQVGMKTARSLFVVDDAHHLVGKVLLSAVALADPKVRLADLQQPVQVSVRATDPIDEIGEAFESGQVLDIPVVNVDGVLVGVVTHENLADSIRSDSATDLQTMVGAGKDERALSSPWFTVKKRMPWLQINLVTAFMAAAVVGVFEQTIAQVTALAVLLPVVAGQSGNTGAQALAVTMRGLALREITVRQWARVMRKEVVAGFINGLAVAATCGLGVYLWSQSLGLVAVIMSSMVLAMIAAGFAGAIIPVLLTRLGQDPATSSSIILTTVTDVAGFFAFLGIASLLMEFL